MSQERTWWAPSHLPHVNCCCHHPDAGECMKIRMSFNGGSSIFDWRDDRCDCCCHEPELDEDSTEP